LILGLAVTEEFFITTWCLFSTFEVIFYLIVESFAAFICLLS